MTAPIVDSSDSAAWLAVAANADTRTVFCWPRVEGALWSRLAERAETHQ